MIKIVFDYKSYAYKVLPLLMSATPSELPPSPRGVSRAEFIASCLCMWQPRLSAREISIILQQILVPAAAKHNHLCHRHQWRGMLIGHYID